MSPEMQDLLFTLGVILPLAWGVILKLRAQRRAQLEDHPPQEENPQELVSWAEKALRQRWAEQDFEAARAAMRRAAIALEDYGPAPAGYIPAGPQIPGFLK